ncbi:MAG: hypothetical protein ACOCU5_03380, partial [Bacillota bacterium]
ERVQDELFKLLDAPNNKDGLKAMVDTDFHGALYGLKEPIQTLASTQVSFNKDEAMALLFMDTDLDNAPWKLSNDQKRKIQAIKTLHGETLHKGFAPMHLYTYGKPLCLIANTVNMIRGDSDRSKSIETLDNTLEVRSLKELEISGAEIRKTLPITHPKEIGRLLNSLLDDVLEGRVRNTHHDLKKAALNYLKTYESEQ